MLLLLFVFGAGRKENNALQPTLRVFIYLPQLSTNPAQYQTQDPPHSAQQNERSRAHARIQKSSPDHRREGPFARIKTARLRSDLDWPVSSRA